MSVFLPKLRWRPKKKSSLKFSPVFGPKLGEDQEKRSSPTVSVLKPSAQITRGKGGPCHNFAYYSMLIILFRRPKGGAMAQWPSPKYAPESAYRLHAFHRHFCYFSKYFFTGVPKPGGDYVWPYIYLSMVYISIPSNNLTLVCIWAQVST